jgi:hypothetical protein
MAVTTAFLLNCNKDQRAQNEYDGTYGTDLTQDRFIAFAFLFAKQLFRAAADGPRKSSAVAVLQQDTCNQH